MSSIQLFALNLCMRVMIKSSNQPMTLLPTFFSRLKISIKLSKFSWSPMGNPVSSSISTSPFFSPQVFSSTGPRQTSFLSFVLSAWQRVSSEMAKVPERTWLQSTLQMSKSFCPGSGQIGFNQKKFWRLWGLDPNHLPLIRMRRSIAPVLYIIIIDHLNLNSVTSSSHLITPLKYPLPLSRITVSKVNQSRDIWHYNSKELDMEPEEIREILRKKDGGKIDTYVQRNTRKREVQGNLMNLLQTWTHSLLYYKRIYPQEAFVERQLLGVTVFSVSSPPLKEYLDTFFASLQPHLQHLNYFQILVLSSSNCLIERNTLHIQSFQSAQLLQENLDDEEKSSIHSQIEMKQFIYDLESFFLKGFINTKQEEVSFRFRMGYRLEKGSDAVPSTVVEEWVKRDKIPSKQQLIVGSLKAEALNLIYEIMSQ